MPASDSPVPNKPLHGMFTAIPHRYDLINHVMTWGLDKRWRDKAARECLTHRPSRVLDLCCGTGDLAINLARLAGENVEINAVDYSQPMLVIAIKKAHLSATGRKISFVYADAAGLPFPDGYFNCVGISFAFRNLTYKSPLMLRYLSEVFRVLKPGGGFVIVETSQPRSKLLRNVYHLYLGLCVFRIGYLLSGNKMAYRYFAESAARFHSPAEIIEILLKSGFRQVSFQPLFLGVAGIHVATK